MPPEIRVLCLGARTSVDDVADAELRALLKGPVDWEALWSAAVLHDAVPLLERTLPPRAGDRLPADWAARALRRRHATLRSNATLRDALARTLTALDAAGVPAMPVKGIVLAEALYGDIALRPASDIDVLVRPADLVAARAVLAGIGYAQATEQSFTALVHEFHDPPYYLGTGRDQVRLELHRALWAPRFFGLGVEDLWDRAAPGTVAGIATHVLSLEDSLIHLAIHRSRSPLRLRWVADVAELVRRYGATLDWDAVVSRANAAGATTALWVVLDLADWLLGAAPPRAVLDAIRPPAVKRLILARTCGAPAMFRPVADDNIGQQSHLTLRVFEQDGLRQIARALASSVGRSIRRILHEANVVRVHSPTG